MVSVIIPVYNRERILKDCLQSVFDQSYEDVEIITIDDGSTDGSLEICREAAERDPRVVILEGEHKGVSGARNKGLDAAKGEYIFFLDSDDVIHPSLFEVFVREMDRTGAAMAGTGVVSFRDRNRDAVKEHIRQDRETGEMTYQTPEQTVYGLFHGGTPINLIGGVMMRRDWIGQTRFKEDLFIGEDYYFIYENVIKGADALFLKQKWYYNRHHDSNISWDYSYEAFWSRFYRRVLVWQNEERLGRMEYVTIQKRDAVGVINRCLIRNKCSSPDSKKIRAVMKEYKKDILPALPWKSRVLYYLGLYLPRVYIALIKRK